MSHLSLFEGYGIELEYMIVDRETLKIRPISDQILKTAAGEQVSDFEDGDITWSNELVLHVLELKTTSPASSLKDYETSFSRSVKKINALLEPHGACLMPTAMHPFMDPAEMRLWPHDNNEIYAAYNRIFDCRGHGWSNLQSMHINLPFKTDEEFERLHTAIRFLLPILPALTASSPIVEGHPTGNADSRLLFYQQNQKRIPSIAGQVIPDLADSIRDYHEKILEPIYGDIAPHDPDEMMREDWLNSRGAIARFGRQTIEIRILDLQEAPIFDLSLADLISTTLKSLVRGDLISRETQRSQTTAVLKSIFDLAARSAENAVLADENYAAAWNLPKNSSLKAVWQTIFSKLKPTDFMSPTHATTASALIEAGSLSSRITKKLGPKPSRQSIEAVFKELCQCLKDNKMFGP